MHFCTFTSGRPSFVAISLSFSPWPNTGDRSDHRHPFAPESSAYRLLPDVDHTSNESEDVLVSNIMMAHIQRNSWSKLLTSRKGERREPMGLLGRGCQPPGSYRVVEPSASPE